MRRSLLLDIYRLTGLCLYPLARLLAPISPAFPGRSAYLFPERLGLYPGLSADRAPTVWLHAASMGEVQAALVLLAALREQFGQYRYVLSVTSRQGHELARARLRDLSCIMAPLDMPQAVNRAIDLIGPALYICLDTELWPLLLTTLSARAVPLVLLNGRMSERSFRRYRRLAPAIAGVLSSFSRMALIGEADRRRFGALGVAAGCMQVTGNLKFDAPFDEAGAGAIRAGYRRRLGLAEEDRLLLCGSTHGGEEALLVAAWQELCRKRAIPLVLALAPRHLERLAEVENLLQEYGLAWQRLSALAGKRTAPVILVDTMGELADLYAAGDCLFCGGSLLPRLSGHNLMEAARWGRPVYFGPYTRDWQDAANLLAGSGGGFRVADMAELVDRVGALLCDAHAYERACRAAHDCAASQRGALARQLAVAAEFL